MSKVALCKFCGAAFLQRLKTQITCSPACRRKLNYKLDHELPNPEKKKTPPAPKKPKPKKPKQETIEDCKYKKCRYRGKIGADECCDYCFVTGHLRGCKISECTHALEDEDAREATLRKLRRKGIM